MQFVIILAFVGIMALMVLIYKWEERIRIKQLRIRLRESYGKAPERKQNLSERKETIALYYKQKEAGIPEAEKVDEITWNDLELDRMFDRVNTAMSFAGEQVLYCRLHRLPEDKRKLKAMEQAVTWFDVHPKEREDTQVLLSGLKKEEVNYYIPEYMELLEMQRIPYIRICRVLQCTLIVLILLAVFTMNPVLIAAAFTHFLGNIALYAVGKGRYEFFMEALYGIIRIVKVSEALADFCIKNSLDAWPEASENEKKLEKVAKSGAL